MAGFECGSFTWPNTTAQQTINLNDTGLTPKAVIMWTAGPGAEGFSAGAIFSIGYGTRRSGSTQSGCVGIISIDNVGTSDTARVQNTTLLHVLSSTSATDYTITLDSFGAGTITVTSSSGANANGDILHYMVFGGSAITDAIVLNWTMDATAGTEVVTGTGFQADALFGISGGLNNTGTITAGLGLGWGWASSNTAFISGHVNADDGDTMTSGMTWNRSVWNSSFLVGPNGAAGIDARWDLDSFDSDGATLGLPDAPSTTTIATLLFIKGGTWEAGGLAKDTDTGADAFSLTNGSLTPNGLIMFAPKSAINTQTQADHDMCWGAADGTRQIVAGITGVEAVNTAVDRFRETDACIEELTGNTPTETSVATFSSFGAGSFNLNWSSNGGAANIIGYMAFDVDGGGGEGTFSSDGVAAPTFTGKSRAVATYASDGVGALSGVGKSRAVATATSAGVGAATFTGQAAFIATFSSAGVGAGSFASKALAKSTYASDGVGALTGVSKALAKSTLSSDGVGALSGIGKSRALSTYSSNGVATADFVDGTAGGVEIEGDFFSDGVATGSFIGKSFFAALMNAQGLGDFSALSDNQGDGFINYRLRRRVPRR